HSGCFNAFGIAQVRQILVHQPGKPYPSVLSVDDYPAILNRLNLAAGPVLAGRPFAHQRYVRHHQLDSTDGYSGPRKLVLDASKRHSSCKHRQEIEIPLDNTEPVVR